MRKVRNADDFLLCIRQIRDQYEQTFGPEITRLRAQYTNGSQKQRINALLECHCREYFVNYFLAALNWRQNLEVENGLPDLPNLFSEAPVLSQERQTVRFLDYLGKERQTNAPLLIVETKRPGADLPKPLGSFSGYYPDIIMSGLRGKSLTGEWNKWLRTLKDYVASVKAKSGKPPKRVVITNGEWLILF